MRPLHTGPTPDADELRLMMAATGPDPTDPVYAWARGYLAGYDTGHAHGRAAGHDEHTSRCEPYWTELVRQAGRRAERAGASKAWDESVRRGENPSGKVDQDA